MSRARWTAVFVGPISLASILVLASILPTLAAQRQGERTTVYVEAADTGKAMEGVFVTLDDDGSEPPLAKDHTQANGACELTGGSRQGGPRYLFTARRSGYQRAYLREDVGGTVPFKLRPLYRQ